MQVASVAGASSLCLHSTADQCSDLAGCSDTNVLASLHPAAVHIGPRNFVLRVSALRTCMRFAALDEKFLLACICRGTDGARSVVLACSVLSDRLFYGIWTLPPVRFLYFNIAQLLAVFYGRNRPDYYLTEGLPLLLTTALPFAIVGLWSALRAPPAVGASNPPTAGNAQVKTSTTSSQVVEDDSVRDSAREALFSVDSTTSHRILQQYEH